MPGPEATGPFCQSCGMPLQDPEDFGTSADGLKSEHYCRLCFQSGVFTRPEVSVQGVVDRPPPAARQERRS